MRPNVFQFRLSYHCTAKWQPACSQAIVLGFFFSSLSEKYEQISAEYMIVLCMSDGNSHQCGTATV